MDRMSDTERPFADYERDLKVYLEITVRLPEALFYDASQQEIAEWLDEEYPSLAGFVADYPVAFAMARVSNPANKLMDYQRVIKAWRTDHSDGDADA